MPTLTQTAVNWALQQNTTDILGNNVPITRNMPSELVDKVRQYFNTNNIPYSTFSYNDLLPFLN